jgi:hypothetical protein
MGDGAGRSPGSRVVAFIRPSRSSDFADFQWSYADEGSPLTVAGAATDYCERRSDRVPSFLPGANRGTNASAIISMAQFRVKMMHDSMIFPAEITPI